MAEQAHKVEVEDTPTTPMDAPTYATAGTPSDGEAATSTPSDGGTSEHSGKIPDEELEEETCGFCKFMKAGPCGTVFKAWEDCIDEHKEDKTDYVMSCLEPTKQLKACMELNPEYYGPVLELEKEEEEQNAAAAAEQPNEESAAGNTDVIVTDVVV
mmetsp:Transcript_16452/g.27671  ORF Transcript_16452/g.27671 Transcript_16452/m.27671 type:complete len:156 (-) Transcript_16452:274-741(-)|eukprot:CAMPEP_0198206906 /NCGR_PEP_ID=MMETSP1445-20131203/10426_1 /TAXON_ID=36898 /ORGANISM="Pyramimonas sp., Strain CCMP2087" /LENGTH=155 /DNA_ID=CAMNT_0043879771 /DNA_START=277 /DNA_END=744 /DNA_ORIENTATION=+